MENCHVQVRKIDVDSAGRLIELAGALAMEYGTAAHLELIEQVPSLSAELGLELVEQQYPGDQGLFVLRGIPVDDAEIGPTPNHWSMACKQRSAAWEILMLLLASAMGRVFGWEGQQDGRLVHDIVPSPGQEKEQTGASSSVWLSLHTEDAFHPRRAHVLLLACLRNETGIATHASSVRNVELNEDDWEALSQPLLPILPDASYYAGSSFTAGEVDISSPGVATTWSRADGRCLRFDPAYTPLERADERYHAAYRRLERELHRRLIAVQLAPGDVLVIDNDVVVHGREPFEARYDGTDRWLKRVNVRLPGALQGQQRPAQEAAEHGYGQQIVDPYQD
jgi:L-asparagine oxygenase